MRYRVLTLIWKELLHLARDRLLAPLVILGPVLELVLVAYSTSVGIQHLPTAVVDMDRTWASRALVVALENARTFDVSYYLSDSDQVTSYLDNGTASVAVIIPPGLADGLAGRGPWPPQVQVIVDGSEPAAAQAALEAAQGVVTTFGQTRAREELAGRGESWTPVNLSLRVWFNEEMSEANYTTPSEAGFMLAAVALMVASLGIARERERGTLEQLLVTPLRPIELIIGKAVPGVILGYVVFLMMLGIIVFGFHVPMRGSWPLLLILAFFYILVELGWGIMISAVSRTQWQALLLVMVLVFAEMTFSGYAFPVELMPTPLRLLSNLAPIKHWLLVFRAILLKGAGPEVFWPELLALAVLGTIIMSMTVLVLRRKQLD
jgi:ABC-2 type transport system permease protein